MRMDGFQAGLGIVTGMVWLGTLVSLLSSDLGTAAGLSIGVGMATALLATVAETLLLPMLDPGAVAGWLRLLDAGQHARFHVALDLGRLLVLFA